MYVIVQHTVADYDVWKPGFDAHGTVRAAHGCTEHRVLRSIDNPNAITVELRFGSAAQVQGFLSDPSLKETMDKFGVTSAPVVSMLDEVEQRTYTAAAV